MVRALTWEVRARFGLSSGDGSGVRAVPTSYGSSKGRAVTVPAPLSASGVRLRRPLPVALEGSLRGQLRRVSVKGEK